MDAPIGLHEGYGCVLDLEILSSILPIILLKMERLKHVYFMCLNPESFMHEISSINLRRVYEYYKITKFAPLRIPREYCIKPDGARCNVLGFMSCWQLS